MKTLVIVDPQNDFMPGGSLEVANGDAIIPFINLQIPQFDLIVATQDWHPQHHGSFASNHPEKEPFEKTKLGGLDQILWPDHCVQGTSGAEFHPDLETDRIEAIFRKGMDSSIDSYSGFYDNGHKKSTGLSGYLREKGADELFFCGLAADICVYFTILDAIKENFKTHLLLQGTRPLDQDEFEKIKVELSGKGTKMIS